MKSMKFCNMHLVGVTGGWLTKRAADKSQRARLKVKLRVALAANANRSAALKGASKHKAPHREGLIPNSATNTTAVSHYLSARPN